MRSGGDAVSGDTKSILGSNAKISYDFTPQLCFSFPSAAGATPEASLENTRYKASDIAQKYLTKIAGSDLRRVPGILIRNFNRDGDTDVCIVLDMYSPDLASKVIKDLDSVEKVPDSQLSFMSQASMSATESGSKRSFSNLRVTNHALPYALGARKLFEENGLDGEQIFSLFQKYAGAEGDSSVMNLNEADRIYSMLILSLKEMEETENQ